MNSINECKQWVETHRDAFFEMMRIYLGIGLAVKAVWFMSHSDYLTKMMDEVGNFWFAPYAIGHIVVAAHLIGGICLAAGLVTRLAALIQIPVLVGAIFYFYLPKMMLIEERQSLEFSALVLFLLALIFVRGGGRWSLDYILSKKTGAQSSGAPAVR